MDAAFMTTWTFPFPGREQQALEFAAQSVQFWSRHAAEGTVHGTGVVLLP